MDTTTLTDQDALVMKADQRRFPIRPHHILGWLLVGISLFAASAALGGSDSAAEAQSNDGVLFGAFARAEGGQTQIQAYEELERQLGTKLQVARTFSTWEDNLDNRRITGSSMATDSCSCRSIQPVTTGTRSPGARSQTLAPARKSTMRWWSWLEMFEPLGQTCGSRSITSPKPETESASATAVTSLLRGVPSTPCLNNKARTLNLSGR